MKRELLLPVMISILLISGCVQQEKEMVVKQPNVAGTFYPGEENTLNEMIDVYLSRVNMSGLNDVRGLVLPHAGFVYSGPVAAYGFKTLEGGNYETVIIMGPSHHVRFSGFSIPNATHYRTPLGLVELSEDSDLLRENEMFFYEGRIHEKEHSAEVQIPFLQRVLDDFSIIPIITGDIDPASLAGILEEYTDEKTLIIASSDLSHYHAYEEANSLDAFCINSIPALDFRGMDQCECCGRIPVLALMYMAEEKGWTGELLDYRNSGDTAGDKSSVVGYASIAFLEEEGMSDRGKETLLYLARKTLESYYENGTAPKVNENAVGAGLRNVRGCFVTLNKNGSLRGCIGHILPQEKLYRCVVDNALSAALYDRRFEPVTGDELDDIRIEISVLTVPEEVGYSSPEGLLEKLRPGTDGVIIRYQGRTSTYLPQVWEQIPEKEAFLSRLCIKQGSPPDCWEEATIETYRAEVFGEQNRKKETT